MDPFNGTRHVDGASLRKALGRPLSQNVSGAHTPFIADAMLLVD